MKLEQTAALINEMHGQMKRVQSANAVSYVVLGTIQDDFGLKLDDFSAVIPKGSYMMSLHLTKTQIHYERQSETYCKKVESEELRKLRPGDRVICVRAGTEAIVLAIVVSDF